MTPIQVRYEDSDILSEGVEMSILIQTLASMTATAVMTVYMHRSIKKLYALRRDDYAHVIAENVDLRRRHIKMVDALQRIADPEKFGLDTTIGCLMHIASEALK
jgi:hypothetical protein